MKKILLVLIMFVFVACETAEQKEFRLLEERVEKAGVLEDGILKCLKMKQRLILVRDGLESKQNYIIDYNLDLSYYFGTTNDLDVIDGYLKEKSNDFYKYLLKDAYASYSDNPVKIKEYTDESKLLLEKLRD